MSAVDAWIGLLVLVIVCAASTPALLFWLDRRQP